MNEQLIDKYDEWTEGEFESSIRGGETATRKGLIKGRWGVCEISEKSSLIHLATGLLAVDSKEVDIRELAQAADERWEKLGRVDASARGDEDAMADASAVIGDLRKAFGMIYEARINKRLASAPEIELSIVASLSLTADQIWPDGDWPENPTAKDVLEVMKNDASTPARLLSEWNLDDDIDMDVVVGTTSTHWNS